VLGVAVGDDGTLFVSPVLSLLPDEQDGSAATTREIAR
jgi:hypothetical protein